MFDIHPDLFRITFSAILIDALGSAYELGGNDKDGIDCSGLIYYGMRESNILIVDRNTEEMSSDLFSLKHSPVYGPRLPLLISYLGGETPAWHCAYQINGNVVIHATTGTSLGEGVVISRVTDYHEVLVELGYTTQMQWFKPSFLEYWGTEES
jgi:cell wall-associated NlpC family hydrolase